MSTIKSSAENLTLNADGANNDIKFQSNGSEVASIDQAGLVTSAGATMSGVLTVNAGGNLGFQGNGTTYTQVWQTLQSPNDLVLKTTANKYISFQPNSTEKVRIHSSGVTSFNNGIELGSGLDATAANTLDDYEEGTWTPTAIGGLSGLTATDCHYRKIGSLVHIAGRVNAFTGINTATLQFGGLPFNPTHSTSSGTVSTTFVDLDQGYQLWMALSHDWDRIYIRYQMNNAQYNSLTGSDISSSSNIHFNATYIVY